MPTGKAALILYNRPLQSARSGAVPDACKEPAALCASLRRAVPILQLVAGQLLDFNHLDEGESRCKGVSSRCHVV